MFRFALYGELVSVVNVIRTEQSRVADSSVCVGITRDRVAMDSAVITLWAVCLCV